MKDSNSFSTKLNQQLFDSCPGPFGPLFGVFFGAIVFKEPKNQGGHKTETAVSLQQFCLQIQLDSDNLPGPLRLQQIILSFNQLSRFAFDEFY